MILHQALVHPRVQLENEWRAAVVVEDIKVLDAQASVMLEPFKNVSMLVLDNQAHGDIRSGGRLCNSPCKEPVRETLHH